MAHDAAAAAPPAAAQVVKVGVGVLLVKRPAGAAEPLVLIGRRKGSHGEGMYALPGGHLEYGETFQQCGIREVEEETGIDLSQTAVEFAYATGDLIDGTKHYVTIFVRADVPDDVKAELREPHKCDGWEWVPYSQIPDPKFPPIASLLASPYKLQ